MRQCDMAHGQCAIELGARSLTKQMAIMLDAGCPTNVIRFIRPSLLKSIQVLAGGCGPSAAHTLAVIFMRDVLRGPNTERRAKRGLARRERNLCEKNY